VLERPPQRAGPATGERQQLRQQASAYLRTRVRRLAPASVGLVVSTQRRVTDEQQVATQFKQAEVLLGWRQADGLAVARSLRYAPAFAAVSRGAPSAISTVAIVNPSGLPPGESASPGGSGTPRSRGSLPCPRFSSSQRAKRRWARTRSARGRVA
jgi:hypothetical protein